MKRALALVLCTLGCSAHDDPAQRPTRAAETEIVPVEEPAPRVPEEPETPPGSRLDARTPEDRRTLAVGAEHGCAIVSERVWCWGNAAGGRLGHSGGRAARVRGLDRVVAIAAGERHTCAIVRGGTIRCWGEARAAGGRDDRFDVRRDVPGVEGAEGIAAGGSRTCWRARDGSVACFEGNGPQASIALGAPAAAVQVGHSHACARLRDGGVRCWGENRVGQIGDGTSRDAASPTAPRGVSDVVRIASGDAHVCAIERGGELWCWGDVRRDPRYSDEIVPPGKRAEGVTEVFAGGDGTCFFLDAGGTRCTTVHLERVWPSGARGHAVLPQVSLPEGTLEVALSSHHRCVRNARAEVLCWGNNMHGESGGSGDYVTEPTAIGL